MARPIMGGAPIPSVPGSGATAPGLSQFGPRPAPGQQGPSLLDLGNNGRGYRSNRGPYATSLIRTEAEKAARYRAASQQAAAQQADGAMYVFTGASDRAEKSFKSVESLLGEFESMANQQKKNLAKLLAMAGYLNVPYANSLEETVGKATLMDVGEAYKNLLLGAAKRFASGQTITPDDLLDMNIRYNFDREGFEVPEGGVTGDNADAWFNAATGKTGKPYTEVRKDKQADIWSAEDARGLARRTLQDVLGRDPSEAEYEDFVAALQTKQRNNPVETTTRTRYDAEGNVIGVNQERTGGLSESAISSFAQDQAEESPDYAEWQAVGTYFPALMQMLGSGVSGA